MATRGQENTHTPAHDEREAAIQDEIRRRILEKEQALQEEKHRRLQTQATLEALEGLTDVPAEEAQKIARQVRAEYTVHQNLQIAQKQATRTTIRVAIVLVGILLLSIGGVWYHRTRRFAKISYTPVFATGLDQSNEPVNNLTELSIGVEHMYLYISWQFLPSGTHTCRLRVFDGNGSVAWEHRMEFSTNDPSHNTWFWYHPKKFINSPGQWRFEVFLDGKYMFERTLTVNPL